MTGVPIAGSVSRKTTGNRLRPAIGLGVGAGASLMLWALIIAAFRVF